MARILSRALLRNFTPYRSPSLAVKSPQLIIPLCSHCRYSSSFKPQFIEINLASSSSSESGGGRDAEGERESTLIQKMEEIIHRLMLQKSTPDWLPFVPGSSFWVPPHKQPLSVKQLVVKLTDKLSDEEYLSLNSARGWPCSSFFISPQETAAAVVEKEDEVYEAVERQLLAGLDSEDGVVPVQVLEELNSGDGDVPVQVLIGSDLEDGEVAVQVLEGSDSEEG